VATLVEGDELQDENEAGGLIQTSNDETVEDFLDPKWDPEPVDAAPRKLSAECREHQLICKSSDLANLAISSVLWSVSMILVKSSSRSFKSCWRHDF